MPAPRMRSHWDISSITDSKIFMNRASYGQFSVVFCDLLLPSLLPLFRATRPPTMRARCRHSRRCFAINARTPRAPHSSRQRPARSRPPFCQFPSRCRSLRPSLNLSLSLRHSPLRLPRFLRLPRPCRSVLPLRRPAAAHCRNQCPHHPHQCHW